MYPGTNVVMTAKDIAEENTILRCTVGSGLHGLALEGTDDHDEMGICIEPPEYVVGLQHFEQWVYRTQPEGVRSGPGDLDLTVYSLRKWCRLALNGNPTVIMPLYAPPDALSVLLPPGNRLRALAPAFASRRAGQAFLGYLTAQKQRLLGERGQMRVKRPELVAQHGYDSKYATHMLRLGVQGVEYLRTGHITLPMPAPDRQMIMDVRRGGYSLQFVTTWCGQLEQELADLRGGGSPLPEKPDYEVVDTFLVAEYGGHWAKDVFT